MNYLSINYMYTAIEVWTIKSINYMSTAIEVWTIRVLTICLLQ